MPITWDAESDAVLFRAIVAYMPSFSQLSTEQREDVVAFMRRNSFPDATWEAVRYVVCSFSEYNKEYLISLFFHIILNLAPRTFARAVATSTFSILPDSPYIILS